MPRVVERTSASELRLSAIFGDAAASFVIRRDAARSPVDVISARGLLSSSAPEWLSLAAECADSASSYQQPVLLASSDADLMVLHHIRCTFTSAAELGPLSGNDVRALFAGRAKHRQQRRYNLTFPGWQIAECIYRPDPKIVSTLQQIAQIPSHYHRDPADVFDVWMPTKAEFRAIRSALSFRDRKFVRQAVVNSLKKSRFTPAAALSLIRDRAEIDYGAVLRNLGHEIKRSDLVPHCGEVKVALARFRKAFDAKVLNKFLDPGAATNDPWEGARSFMGADLADCWFESLDVVVAARGIIAGDYPDRRYSDEQLEKRLRLLNSFAKLYALGPAALTKTDIKRSI